MATKKGKPTGDCQGCGFKKGMMNKAKGKKLPGGGKCTYPGGFCSHKDVCNQKEKGASPQAPETTAPDSPKPGYEIELSLIYPNPDQPRKIFLREALEELAQSIKEQGLIEPLVVAPRGEGKPFMLIAGERRWRACKLAGLEKVPVHIIKADDRQIAEMALVENLQRQDLTPLEEAKAFQAMIDSGYTREELARKLGFKQVWRVDERLSLLNLVPKYQEAMVHGIISPSQAFEMSRLSEPEEQELVFRKIKGGELPTYNHLRRFVNALVEARKQTALFALPKKEDLEVVSRWEKALDAVTGLVVKSFAPEDCRVLAKVYQGNTQVNLAKIDLIVRHLNMIKKAMMENAGRQEVMRMVQGEEHRCEASSLST